MAKVPSKVYSITVLSNDLPDDALRACAIACGIAMNNYFQSAHMPTAIKGDPNTIFGKSWDICQRVDDWKSYRDSLNKSPTHSGR